MRILVIHPYFLERGGAERKILLLANHLISMGHDVEIFCFKKDIEKSFSELAKNLDIRSFKFSSVGRFLDFKRKSQFDLGIASNYPAHFLMLFFKLLRNINKTIWICNEVHSSLHDKKKLKHKLIIPIEKYIVKYFDLIISKIGRAHV